MTLARHRQRFTAPSSMGSGCWLCPRSFPAFLASYCVTELVTPTSVLDLHTQLKGWLGLFATSDACLRRSLTLHHCAQSFCAQGHVLPVVASLSLLTWRDLLQLARAFSCWMTAPVCLQHMLSLELLLQRQSVLCRRSPTLRCTCRMGGGCLGLTLRLSRTSTCARPGGLLRWLKLSPAAGQG